MATKDISDRQVCEAVDEMRRRRSAGERGIYADDILRTRTGEAIKVCERALERASNRGLIDCGMWLRGSWLTDKGKALLGAQAQAQGLLSELPCDFYENEEDCWQEIDCPHCGIDYDISPPMRLGAMWRCPCGQSVEIAATSVNYYVTRNGDTECVNHLVVP